MKPKISSSGNPKDRAESCEKYNGQYRRTIKTRYGEHLDLTKYDRSEKGSVAYHVSKSEHSVVG